MTSKVRNLLYNVVNALLFAPPNYLRSLLGNASSWQRSSNAATELQLLERENFPANLQTARDILLPAWPGKPRWIPDIATSSGLCRVSSTGLYPDNSEPGERYTNESWLFLNGICADKKIADLNADYLYRLFGRQLTVLHNQTHGFVLDLAECAIGKGWLGATEAVQKLFPAFYSELKRPDIERVVLIAHSQGTILAAVFIAMLQQLLKPSAQPKAKANTATHIDPGDISPEARCARELLKTSLASLRKAVVRIMQQSAGPAGCRLINLDTIAANSKQHLLESVQYWLDWSADSVLGLPPLTAAELSKLEVYNFATCATEMPTLVAGEQPAPYIEHFGNGHDLVARLGLFAPQAGPGSTRIEGQRFICADGWGHLLNAHYLQPLEQQWQADAEVFFEPLAGQTASQSRLQGYYRQIHPVAVATADKRKPAATL